MKKFLCLALLLFTVGCGASESRPLRQAIEIVAVSLATADSTLASTVAVVEPGIAEHVRQQCVEVAECMAKYNHQMEPWTYAAESVDAAMKALRILEAAVDIYDRTKTPEAWAEMLGAVNALTYSLSDLIAQLRGLGVDIPPQLEAIIFKLEALTRGDVHGPR